MYSTARYPLRAEVLADCVDAFVVTPTERAAAPLGVHLSMQLLLDSLPLRGGDERQTLSLLSTATTVQHGEFLGDLPSPRHAIALDQTTTPPPSTPPPPQSSATTDDLPASPSCAGAGSDDASSSP